MYRFKRMLNKPIYKGKEMKFIALFILFAAVACDDTVVSFLNSKIDKASNAPPTNVSLTDRVDLIVLRAFSDVYHRVVELSKSDTNKPMYQHAREIVGKIDDIYRLGSNLPLQQTDQDKLKEFISETHDSLSDVYAILEGFHHLHNMSVNMTNESFANERKKFEETLEKQMQ